MPLDTRTLAIGPHFQQTHFTTAGRCGYGPCLSNIVTWADPPTYISYTPEPLQNVLSSILQTATSLLAMGFPRETGNLLLVHHRSRGAIIVGHCSTDSKIFQ